METRIIYSGNVKGDEHDWQILSLNIPAHGSKFRKNDSVPNEGYQELCFDIDISLFPTTSFSV